MDEESLFHAALAKPASERPRFLDEACSGRPELRAAVASLLAAHDASGGVLEPAAKEVPVTADQASPASRVEPEPRLSPTLEVSPKTRDSAAPTGDYRLALVEGAVIADRYVLQERIGEGGMGEVWVAKQTEPVKRKVALKLIKPGMDSRAVLQRFEQERQALALMDHPNIARVFDAGLTSAGRPFFAMELVNGLPLTRYCDHARLGLRDRLELFLPICRAVQHAHQKGIVHRDLKPANILVTLIDARPAPKVIDFGVAKATGGKLTEESLSTQFGAIVGTLEYMSPEQAAFSGDDIDTRSDIYSLGVILYELLTGLRPIDAKRLKSAALTEMIRAIREDEPSKPSTRLSTDESLASQAALRGMEPRKLMSILRGDLDWVVMRCLEKPRDRRYETANGLARDIERYLADEPVEAGPPSARYRIRKFARRNRAAIAGLGAFCSLLIVAAAVSGVLAYRAEHERARAVKAEAKVRAESEKVLAVNNFLTADLLMQAEPVKNDAENRVTLLEVLDRAADKAGERFRRQPELEFAVRRSIARAYHGLASWDKAERQARVLSDLSKRPAADPAEAYLAMQILSHVRMHQGRIDEPAIAMAQTAAEGLAGVLGADDAEALDARNDLALAYQAAGRWNDAISVLEALLKHCEEKLGPLDEGAITARQNLAIAYNAAGRTADALPLFARSLEESEKRLGPDHPGTLSARHNLAVVLMGTGRASEAIPMLEQTLKRRESKLGADHSATNETRLELARAYRSAGRKADAVSVLERALARNDSLPIPKQESPLTMALAHGLAHEIAATRPADAESLFRRALKYYRETEGPDGPLTYDLTRDLAITLSESRGRAADAEPFLRDFVALRRRRITKEDDPELSSALSALNRCLVSQKKWGDAEPVLRELLALREKFAPDQWTTFETQTALGGVLLSMKALPEAERLLLRGYEGLKLRLEKIPARSRALPARAARRLADAYDEMHQPEKAAKYRKEAEELEKQAEPPKTP